MQISRTLSCALAAGALAIATITLAGSVWAAGAKFPLKGILVSTYATGSGIPFQVVAASTAGVRRWQRQCVCRQEHLWDCNS
jgi:hypothetical protein